MDIMGEQYIDSLCRTCMLEIAESTVVDTNTTSEQQWQSVFDTIDECGAKRIAELITNTMPQIKVHLFDELPKKICLECLQQLLSAYRFQQMCAQSDQQMRELIAKRNTDGNAETSPENEISTDFFAQEFNLEATNFETLPEAPQATTNGTSRSNDEVIEHCEDSQIDLSEFLKNETFYDEPTVEYSDDETLLSANSVKDEVLTVETEEKQISTSSSMHNVHKLQGIVCSLCKKTLSNEFALARHMKIRHANQRLTQNIARPVCDICGMTFSRPFTLERHRRHQHGDNESGNVTCDLCAKTFSSKLLLKKHTRKRHYNKKPQKNVKVQCKLCETTFSRRSSLVRHERRQHTTEAENTPKENITRYPCDLCSNTFSSRFSLERHKRVVHYNERPPKPNKMPTCDLCDVTFSRRSSLLRHNRYQHSTENAQKTNVKLPCDQCGRTFFSYYLLWRHKRIRHAIRKIDHKIPCDICGNIFTNRYSLTRHKMRIHCTNAEELQKEFEKYRCEFCNKGFADSITLRDHIVTHTGERPYLCRQCGTTFITESNLNQHILRHQKISVNKGHDCDICGSSFAKTDQLRRHKLYHGERPFKCDYCELRFVRPDDQRRHMRTHTGEKPYTCKYCGRSFAQCNDRIRHMRIHVGENVYRCELCPAAFRFATELRLHNNEHNNDDEETRDQNMKALMEAEAELGLKFPRNISPEDLPTTS